MIVDKLAHARGYADVREPPRCASNCSEHLSAIGPTGALQASKKGFQVVTNEYDKGEIHIFTSAAGNFIKIPRAKKIR
eukprot:3452671-Heterocapsa_arctica.AAC.1